MKQSSLLCTILETSASKMKGLILLLYKWSDTEVIQLEMRIWRLRDRAGTRTQARGFHWEHSNHRRVHACVLSRFSHVWLCATLWTIARQAPLSMGFSRQEYWSGLPCPPPGDLPDPGIEPVSSLLSPALAVSFFTTSPTWKAPEKSISLKVWVDR